MIEFKRKVSISNGQFISKANIARIVAVSSELCENVRHPRIDPLTYKERWVIKKEEKGYIFREVTHGCGISGHHKTLRQLVMRSCGHQGIKIILEPSHEATNE
jgi:hypothetical protein